MLPMTRNFIELGASKSAHKQKRNHLNSWNCDDIAVLNDSHYVFCYRMHAMQLEK